MKLARRQQEPIEDAQSLVVRLSSPERAALRVLLWEITTTDRMRAWADHDPSTYVEVSESMRDAAQKLLDGLEGDR